MDGDVVSRHAVETIIDLDRKELLSLLREVQDVDRPIEDEMITEADVIWLG